jgi:hypothetical protein
MSMSTIALAGPWRFPIAWHTHLSAHASKSSLRQTAAG